MNTTAVLERPTVVGFEASVKDGVIELLNRSNKQGKKYGITEDIINKEIELYREEKKSK